MSDRRNFIKQLSAAGLLSTMPEMLWAGTGKSGDKIWACLLHLSFNFAATIMNPNGAAGRGMNLNLMRHCGMMPSTVWRHGESIWS